jgi:hypothetical protein
MTLLIGHSHIEWHVEAGLTATLLEAPDHLQGSLTIPASHLKVSHQDGTQRNTREMEKQNTLTGSYLVSIYT